MHTIVCQVSVFYAHQCVLGQCVLCTQLCARTVCFMHTSACQDSVYYAHHCVIGQYVLGTQMCVRTVCTIQYTYCTIVCQDSVYYAHHCVLGQCVQCTLLCVRTVCTMHTIVCQDIVYYFLERRIWILIFKCRIYGSQIWISFLKDWVDPKKIKNPICKHLGEVVLIY